MHPLNTTAPLQQFAALALAAVLTTGVLVSLGAQADTEHAAALAGSQVNAQLACVVPARATRS